MTAWPAIQQDRFVASATFDGAAGVRCSLKGDADMVDPGPMTAFFRDLHMASIEAAVRTVVVDIVELEFASSSSLACIAGWLNRLAEAGPDDTVYGVVITGNTTTRWQKRTMAALQAIAPRLVSIDPVDR